MRSRRVVAAVLAGSFLLAACGGGDDDDAGTAAGGEETIAPADDEQPAPPDEVDVDPASDIPSNVLPDVVVDDVRAGSKVNLRNVAPADVPILVWMWAPH